MGERILLFSFLRYDLGGGTFDVTVLQLQDENLQVLATSGDTYLGKTLKISIISFNLFSPWLHKGKWTIQWVFFVFSVEP